MPSPEYLQAHKGRQGLGQLFQGRVVQMQHHQVSQHSQLLRSMLHATPKTEAEQLQASEPRQERQVRCL